MFFVDKYQPQRYEDSKFHNLILDRLQIISKDESIPHVIFYGPQGSGKKTMIKLFLQMLYDDTVNNIEETIFKVSGSGNNESDVSIKRSNYHIEIEPNNNNFDRYLIQEVVREYAIRMPLNVFTVKKVYKTVLINNVDNLSYYAQTALRRMMEKYSDTCRFILWCRSLSKVIDPLVSRCLGIRVPAPSDNDIFKHVYRVSIEESINMTIEDYIDVVKKANGNIKAALWSLQFKKYDFDDTNAYVRELKKIVVYILQRDIRYIEKIRDILYNVMITNISETDILRDLMTELIESEHVTIDCKYKIVQSASTYEYNLMRCRREILHLEAFIQSVIKILFESNDYKIPDFTAKSTKTVSVKNPATKKKVVVVIDT